MAAMAAASFNAAGDATGATCPPPLEPPPQTMMMSLDSFLTRGAEEAARRDASPTRMLQRAVVEEQTKQETAVAKTVVPPLLLEENGAIAMHAAVAMPQLLLRHCLCVWAAIPEVLACRTACRRWWRLSQDDKWLKRSVLSGGVAPRERRSLWRFLADIPQLERSCCAKLAIEESLETPLDSASGFEVLASRVLPKGKVPEIERDVTRTFPLHPRFRGDSGSAGRAELLRVLRAACAAVPEVGYCQGMNFVAASLLIHLGGRTCDAFWMLLALIRGYHFQHIYAPGVPLLPLRIFQFSGLVRKHLPRLWCHLRAEHFSLDIFAHQCVLTLFAYSIEPEFLAYVYDIFFFIGWKALFQIGLGLLATMEDRLLGMGTEEISRYMRRHFEANEAIGAGGALQTLLRFRVSRATLEELQLEFQRDRLSALLRKVAIVEELDAEEDDEEPLPVGIRRSSSRSRFLMDAHSLSSCNMPPWRLSNSVYVLDKKGNGFDVMAAATAADAPPSLPVPMSALRTLQVKLHIFDADTQRDVELQRRRVSETEQELAELLRSVEVLREEVRQCEVERKEWQEKKQALMETMNVAVKTSPNIRANANGHQARMIEQDTAVVQCLGKLNRLESEIFDKNVLWQAKQREVEPIDSEAVELRRSKGRLMAQLNDYIEARALLRQMHLDASLRTLLPEAAHEHLEDFLKNG